MTQRAFLTSTGRANFTCPECGATKQMDVSKYKDIEKKVNLKCTCKCKHRFTVTLERRRHFRHPVKLTGELHWQHLILPVKVADVSRYGLKIISIRDIELEPETKVILKFTLDDVRQSQVTKELVVKSVSGNQAGLQFISPDHYDKFGNYILFHTT